MLCLLEDDHPGPLPPALAPALALAGAAGTSYPAADRLLVAPTGSKPKAVIPLVKYHVDQL